MRFAACARPAFGRQAGKEAAGRGGNGRGTASASLTGRRNPVGEVESLIFALVVEVQKDSKFVFHYICPIL